jgi:hypothetical protein
MNLLRIFRHLLFADRQLRRAFPPDCLAATGQAIRDCERGHAGEIRFVVEGGLDGLPLYQGQTAKQRALALFSELRVWDTEHNNGVLVYVLLADRAVEIVADRGVHAHAGTQAWEGVCRQMEAAFGRSEFQLGAVNGIHAVGRLLRHHYPKPMTDANELPDEPMLLT